MLSNELRKGYISFIKILFTFKGKMKIKRVNLSKWFPANDPFATKMARICILREELMFELYCALESQNVPMNDEYSSSWQQTYFFRKMHITVAEIRSAVESLARDVKFKAFLKKQPGTFQIEFTELKKNLNSTSEAIKDFRRDVGAHFSEDSIHQALQSMSHERNGFFQISRAPRKTHYEFAEELIMAVMVRNTPNEKQYKKAISIVDALTNTTSKLFHRIDFLFISYLKDRNLV
jgi:hypothetical protein